MLESQETRLVVNLLLSSGGGGIRTHEAPSGAQRFSSSEADCSAQSSLVLWSRSA
jgi:hypothetical protein